MAAAVQPNRPGELSENILQNLSEQVAAPPGTLWGVHSVAMLHFVVFRKFRLPIELYSNCSISPTVVEHVENYVQNITTDWTPHSVSFCWPLAISLYRL